MNEPKHCLCCGLAVRGRSDKKFCNDYCRNRFNNEQKARDPGQPYVRRVSQILLRNRQVLAELLPAGAERGRAHRDQLLQRGFHFTYGTHAHTSRGGTTYRFCFDYGYRHLRNDWYLLVRRQGNG